MSQTHATSTAPVRSVDELLADPPLVHEWMSEDGLITHGLLPEALRFIEATVKPGDRTLETGSGLSTITFALTGARHTCVVPDAGEEERVRRYCEQRGIDASGLRFEIGFSERVLPALELEPLDLLLVDGSHSFPQVFIDWFYAQSALKVGGALIVDDVHIWTGRVLRDFLRAEPAWELTDRWAGRTVAFRKVAEFDGGKDWSDQRYVHRWTQPDTVGRARMAGALLREGQFGEVRRRIKAIVEQRRG